MMRMNVLKVKNWNAHIFLSICFIALSIGGSAQIAEDKCRFLGNIIAGYTPFDFANYWNQVTPENAGKWGSVEGTRDVMSWNTLDNAYNSAMTNGFQFKQHTFVWGQQQPGWITTLSVEEQKEEVEEWIQSYCTRYPETDMIDVVNEPLHAPPDYAVALGGGGATGWDWVIWSFEKARTHCPNAKLILNDYNIINSDAATDAYLVVINILKTRNLIDGIGEQGHFLESTPVNTLKGNLNKLHATGLPIYISEYDINLADDIEQNNKYQEQFPAIWTHPGVHGITLWGYRQNEIWRTNAYLVRANNSERPALTWLKSYVPSVSGGIFCLPVTGTAEEVPLKKIYPNPATHGKFKLALGEGKFEVRILNLQGHLIKQLAITGNEEVDVQLLVPAGVYFIQVFDGQKSMLRKIVVN